MAKFTVVFNDPKQGELTIRADHWSVGDDGYTYFEKEEVDQIPVAGITTVSICSIMEVDDGTSK